MACYPCPVTEQLVQFVASGESRPLWPKLRARLSRGVRLDIASAFLANTDALSQLLVGRGKAQARVVVSSRYPTDPDALVKLRDDLAADVRVARAERSGSFHEKLYIAYREDGTPTDAYVGSANWTRGGLMHNPEAGVLIRDPVLLAAMAKHFERTFEIAEPLAEEHLASLREQHVRQKNATAGRGKDRGRMRWRWESARGRFLLKQNGLSCDPFREGHETYGERFRGDFTGGQTLSSIPSTFANGQGMIITFIARRRDGSPDRLIYGRGLIADLDRTRWRLPSVYRERLLQYYAAEHVDFIGRWPFVVWLDPVEYLDYKGSEGFLWTSELLGISSFQKGYRCIDARAWQRVNSALDEASEHYGLAAVERDGLWWNAYLRRGPDDSLYMSRSLMEELNRA